MTSVIPTTLNQENKKMIPIKVNGKEYSVAEGKSVLQACRDIGIVIPTLCFLDGVSEEASCSICIVEIKGGKGLNRSCVTTVAPNMEITTNSQRVREARRVNLELLLANHPKDCLACERSDNCELRNNYK